MDKFARNTALALMVNFELVLIAYVYFLSTMLRL